ncbi:hypothetical protein [Streptomyces sp. R41]|uniref:Uncharacterized protein n=1 Tax=Streptomyces sp. R41 TaxID=3238632 RepID=A0AB39RX05_9ACTN
MAVLDAATGRKLMETLVRPTEKISRQASWVHGLSDHDVGRAAPWEKVLPHLRRVTRGRTIWAYNADFDRGIVVGDTRRGQEAATPGRPGRLVLPDGGVHP